MDFARTVLTRKMIRAFKPDPVPKDKIERILSIAQHYPSAGYSQEVAFIVVTDKERRKRIRELRDLRSDAPVLLIPCVSEKVVHDRYHEPDKIRSGGREIDWPVPFWYFDVGCSCMLVFLAAVNEGLAASFAGSVGIFKPGILRKELGIPEHYEPVGVLSLGYPDHTSDVPSPSLKRGRRPFRDFVHDDKW
ncbi:nitroreductase family protein [Candidatus Bathyarchaeota archaeon]|nr:MAG: nitroreductase family protein [Candidatus Bathyarchaeota archaeon]